MVYSASDREEFSIQIKEHLDLKVIEPSKSPFSSLAFMVLKTARKEGIVLSKKKAELFKEKIGYLGLEIAYGHKQLNPHILTHIQEFPNEIQDQKQLMRFLGCLTYAESFIKDLAKMRSPLQKKLKKDHKWNWTKDDTLYVQKIKDLPSLYHPKTGEKMIIEIDASQEYWGGVLKALYINDSIQKLCSYSLGTFTEAEKNYHINEKEILAMKKAITKFRLYVISDKFVVRIDYSTFKSFMKHQVKMADINNHIADIKEEIEIKRLEISASQQKIAILEKRLARLEATNNKRI
ncbi:orf y [Abeliophyllum distichum]|uniref:Orf y n=1 Tax=Abeliophyllum distichum TaxID=126358 RepID=A0ABD1TJZ6_9LAMI